MKYKVSAMLMPLPLVVSEVVDSVTMASGVVVTTVTVTSSVVLGCSEVDAVSLVVTPLTVVSVVLGASAKTTRSEWIVRFRDISPCL